MNSIGNYLQTSWDWRAAGNFLLGGSGSALLFVATAAALPDSPSLQVSLVALALVGLGLFSVWLEIGRPWRFLHVFFHPQTSWMTREASVAVLLFLLALCAIALNNPLLMTLAGVAGLIFLFCQGQMLRASRGIPAWREAAIVPLVVATGLCEGTAILLLLYGLQQKDPALLSLICLALLAARLCFWLLYRSRVRSAKAPAATLSCLAHIHLFQVLAGHFFPALLVTVALLMPQVATASASAAGLLALLAGWHLKFTLITRAAQVQGYRLGAVRRGRPVVRPPVRRKPDRAAS